MNYVILNIKQVRSRAIISVHTSHKAFIYLSAVFFSFATSPSLLSSVRSPQGQRSVLKLSLIMALIYLALAIIHQNNKALCHVSRLGVHAWLPPPQKEHTHAKTETHTHTHTQALSLASLRYFRDASACSTWPQTGHNREDRERQAAKEIKPKIRNKRIIKRKKINKVGERRVRERQ